MVLGAGQPFSSMDNDRSMMASSGFTLVRFVLNVNEDDVRHIKLWFGVLSYAAFFFQVMHAADPRDNGSADSNI